MFRSWVSPKTSSVVVNCLGLITLEISLLRFVSYVTFTFYVESVLSDCFIFGGWVGSGGG